MGRRNDDNDPFSESAVRKYSDFEKNMTAYVDQNHASSLTHV